MKEQKLIKINTYINHDIKLILELYKSGLITLEQAMQRIRKLYE